MTIGQSIDLHYSELFSNIIENNFISFKTMNEIEIIQQKREAELEIMSTIVKQMMAQSGSNDYCSESEALESIG